METIKGYLEHRIDCHFRQSDEILARNGVEDCLDLPLIEFQRHNGHITIAVELSIVLKKINEGVPFGGGK
jgi:hypothetical protein